MSGWIRLNSVLLVVAFVASGALTAANAQTTFDDVKQDAHALFEVIGDYSHDRRVALVAASTATLNSIDDNIVEMNAQLRDDWDEMSDAARAKSQAAMDNLQQRRFVVAEKLTALEPSSQESWRDIRASFSTAFANLQVAWETIRQQTKTN